MPQLAAHLEFEDGSKRIAEFASKATMILLRGTTGKEMAENVYPNTFAFINKLSSRESTHISEEDIHHLSEAFKMDLKRRLDPKHHHLVDKHAH